jgi:hypothetical protein
MQKCAAVEFLLNGEFVADGARARTQESGGRPRAGAVEGPERLRKAGESQLDLGLGIETAEPNPTVSESSE